MSPSVEEFKSQIQPYQKVEWARCIPDATIGALFAAFAWVLVHYAFPSRALLIAPQMLVAHAIVAALGVWAIRESRTASRQRRALSDVPLTESTSPAVRMPGGQDLQKTSAWSQAFEECNTTHQNFSPRELPAVFARIGNVWMGQLTVRYSMGLILVTIPLFIGLFTGLSRLTLTQPGEYLGGFTDVFLPLLVITVEVVLCGALIWKCQLDWARVIEKWKLTANNAFWDHLEAKRIKVEQLAAPEREKRAQAEIPQVREDAHAGRGDLRENKQAPTQTNAGGEAEATTTNPPPNSTKENGGGNSAWGAFGGTPPGMRTKGRRDIDQSDA